MSGSAASLRSLRPGDGATRFGVLVTSVDGAAVRGLRVRVRGDALERGLWTATRARARPFSARLLPWEAAGWEHALEPEGSDSDGLGCVLRAARIRGAVRAELAGDEEFARPRERDERAGLAHAVWVEVEGRALRPGRGTLELAVAPMEGAHEGTAVCERVAVLVRDDVPQVCSAFAAWDGAMVAHVEAVRAVLDGFARVVAALPAGERVVLAEGVALDQVRLRPGCAVLGADGLLGDARFRDLARRLRAGGLESFALCAPGGARAADETLSAIVARRGRFGPPSVEMALSVGTARAGRAGVEGLRAALREVVRTAGATRGFVAAHDWVPSVLDAVRDGRIVPPT